MQLLAKISRASHVVKWQKTEFGGSVEGLVLNSYILYTGFKKMIKKIAFLRTCPAEALY